jgi:hypothetical protein
VNTATEFWSRVEKSDGCWHWLGATGGFKDAYGVVWWRRRQTYAHRVSWSIANGPIPAGKIVMHKCDNPICVNPNHLMIGTSLDNSQDMARKGRWKNGDPKGQNNGHAILTEAHVREILTLKDSQSLREIGRRYGVGKNCIGQIFRGITWSHITGISREKSLSRQETTMKPITLPKSWQPNASTPSTPLAEETRQRLIRERNTLSIRQWRKRRAAYLAHHPEFQHE